MAQRVVQQALVEADFERVRHERLGLLQRGERFFIIALAAFDFREPQVRSRDRLGLLVAMSL